MSRQSGYYWVKHMPDCAWETGYWFSCAGCWQLMGASCLKIEENRIYEINETRILTPDEVASE